MYTRSCTSLTATLRKPLLAPTRRPLSTPAQQQTQPRDAQTLALPDGRLLGFAEYGAPAGTPLVFLHGTPGSRLECSAWDDMGTRLGARIIGIDRPGMGLSSQQPGRTMLDHAGDVHALARHLALGRFRVMGGSGGGPYALACAAALPPGLLSGVGILAGVAPRGVAAEKQVVSAKAALLLAEWWPWGFGRVADWLFASAARSGDPEVLGRVVDKWVASLKDKDRAAVDKDKDNSRRLMVDLLRDAFRQGVEGYTEEALVFTRPWGFELEDIKCENVKLWYGDEDENTPVEMGRWMAARVKNAVLREFPGESHFTIANHSEEILKDFLGVD